MVLGMFPNSVRLRTPVKTCAAVDTSGPPVVCRGCHGPRLSQIPDPKSKLIILVRGGYFLGRHKDKGRRRSFRIITPVILEQK